MDDWELEIIAQPAFQRLRRIRQLGWTDYIYPGAMHTRFEHSLGVMDVATRLYDAIAARSSEVLKSEFGYNDDGLRRDRRLVRLAALLHDLGHGPFSHAAEEVFPKRDNGERFQHENYSAAIVRLRLKDAIENHPGNGNYGIEAEDVAAFLEGSVKMAKMLFWWELINGKMDADRMDYLLRDSLHLGVRYGTYDIDRLINTICAVPDTNEENGAPRVGVMEGGWHAAESMVLARYYMFTQVYFHKTRVAYDYHIGEALRKVLPKGSFPKPQGSELESYLEWDDWKMLGLIAENKAGDHGKRILNRNHYRKIYATKEVPDEDDLTQFDDAKTKLGNMLGFESVAEKSWYKVDKTDIPVLMDQSQKKSLSELSSPIYNMAPNKQQLLYVKPEDKDKAETILRKST